MNNLFKISSLVSIKLMEFVTCFIFLKSLSATEFTSEDESILLGSTDVFIFVRITAISIKTITIKILKYGAGKGLIFVIDFCINLSS